MSEADTSFRIIYLQNISYFTLQKNFVPFGSYTTKTSKSKTGFLSKSGKKENSSQN